VPFCLPLGPLPGYLLRRADFSFLRPRTAGLLTFGVIPAAARSFACFVVAVARDRRHTSHIFQLGPYIWPWRPLGALLSPIFPTFPSPSGQVLVWFSSFFLFPAHVLPPFFPLVDKRPNCFCLKSSFPFPLKLPPRLLPPQYLLSCTTNTWRGQILAPFDSPLTMKPPSLGFFVRSFGPLFPFSSFPPLTNLSPPPTLVKFSDAVPTIGLFFVDGHFLFLSPPPLSPFQSLHLVPECFCLCNTSCFLGPLDHPKKDPRTPLTFLACSLL